MALHDNMAPSPERSSSKRKDDGENRSPKKAKKLKSDEGHSSKQFEKNRDEAIFNKSQDDGKEEYKSGRGRKSMRSRSPIQEPSSSKSNLHSKSRSQERNEDRHQSLSERSHTEEGFRENRRQNQDEIRSRYRKGSFRSSGGETREYKERHSSRENKSSNRSKSPAANYKFNEGYSKPLPPGAKERREQQEKERQEQLKKDYANLSYGGKVVTGDGSTTSDYTTIKEDTVDSRTECTEADSTSNTEAENLKEENAPDDTNEMPLEDILQGKNPILYCTLGARFRDLQLEFDQVSEVGPQHDRVFTWKMKIGTLETIGIGNSKKSAKNDAAEKMVRVLYKAPRPARRPPWQHYGPPVGMFPPGMNGPGPQGMFQPIPRGMRPHPGMMGPPPGMFGPRPGIPGHPMNFGGGFVPFGTGFPGPRPPFGGPMPPFPIPNPESCISTPEELEFGKMDSQEGLDDIDLGPPGEAGPTSTMDSLFEVESGSSTMDSLYQPEEGTAVTSNPIATTALPTLPPQFDRFAGANNPISKLYDMAKKDKIPEPLFETINEKVLSERKSQKGFTMKKTEYTIQCDFKGKKYEGKALTKKDAKLASATVCWAEVGGGLPPGPPSLQASISNLLQNQRQAASEAKPQIKAPVENRPGDWQCTKEECNNINFAWRKTCNNCDTKKPRNPESEERELAEEQKKMERRAREATSREHSRETEKHGRFYEKDKPGPSRERAYDRTDDYVDKDRNQRHRNESEHNARPRYSREDQARGAKERHRYEYDKDQPFHQQHAGENRVNTGHYRREQQDYNSGSFRENRHERDRYTSDRHEPRQSDHNRSRNDTYDYERSGGKPHDSNRYESSRYEHESYDRDERQNREGASRRRCDDQREQFSNEMYPSDKPHKDRDHRDRTR